MSPAVPPIPVRAPGGGATAGTVFSAPVLQSVAAEAGWACDARGDGTLVFNVGSAAVPRHAWLAPVDSGGGALIVELARIDSWEPVCTHALEVLLQRLNGFLRLARAAIASRADRTVAVLEVPFQAVPVPLELAAALESLCVGTRLCFEEIQCLSCASVAGEYLEVGMEMFNAS